MSADKADTWIAFVFWSAVTTPCNGDERATRSVVKSLLAAESLALYVLVLRRGKRVTSPRS